MKNTPFVKFLRSISSFAIILILLSFFIFGFIIPQYYLGIFPILLLLFLSVNSAFSYLMEVSVEKRYMVVIRSFLLGWTIKFFIYVLFLIIYVLLNRVNAVNFLIQFASLYLAFSGFEIIYLIRNFKKPDDQVKN
jgi:hypothetical protein